MKSQQNLNGSIIHQRVNYAQNEIEVIHKLFKLAA